MPDSSPELVAYHEAGHALMAVLLGGRVKQVTIDPDNDDGPERYGDTQIRWRRGISDKDFAQFSVQVSLAGPMAEMIYSGDPYHPGLVAEWAADWRDAWEAATILQPIERIRLEFLEQSSIDLYHRLQRDDLWPLWPTTSWLTKRWIRSRWKKSSRNGWGEDVVVSEPKNFVPKSLPPIPIWHKFIVGRSLRLDRSGARR